MSLNESKTILNVSDLLQEARDQGSKFFFKFLGNVSGLGDIRAILLDYNRSTLNMELTGVRAVSHSWEGKPIRCYFKIRDPNDHSREVFYTFVSTLLEAEQRGSGRVIASLKRPDSIETGQRRNSLRVSPSNKNLLDFNLWVYDSQSCIDLQTPHVGVKALEENLAKVENIGAGGIKLTLRRPLLRDLDLTPKLGLNFILRFCVLDMRDDSRKEFWAIAKLRRLEEDPISKDSSLGMEFVASGSLIPETGKMSWQKVAGFVIEELASIFLQWHVEFHREKGV